MKLSHGDGLMFDKLLKPITFVVNESLNDVTARSSTVNLKDVSR